MTNPLRTLAAGLLAAALGAGSTPAQSQGSGGADLARRTFLNAEQLMREGKPDQALRDYQQVIQAFPDSPYADDALMKVGSFHYPPESITGLDAVSVEEQEASRTFFEQVRERYAQSDSAPHAYYKLGLLGLEPQSPRRNLDEAYASFYGVVNIYPDSDWVGNALLGAAVAEIGKRNYDRAILSLDRSLEESPHGPSAAECYLFLGLANARLGDYVRAAEAFQACRLEDEKSRAAAQALDWLSLVYNMRLRSLFGAQPELVYDSSFVPKVPAGEDLRGDLDIAVSPSGELLVADPRRGALLAFGADGSMKKSEPLEGASHVSIDAEGGVILAAPAQIRISGAAFAAARKAGSSVRPIDDPGGAWRTSARDLLVLDLREGELLKYRTDPTDPSVIYKDKDSGTRLIAMAGGPEDRMYLLDRKGENVLVLEGDAVKPLIKPGGGPVLQDPVDLAVDSLGDVYVLDAKIRAVLVLDPEGKRLAKISPAAESPGEMAQPKSIAVGPKGDVYVYDERKRTILRFR